MKYLSTRGYGTKESPSSPLSFEQVLFSGYAPDGGLYVPETIPIIPQSTIDLWKSKCLTYPQVVENIIRHYISQDEIPEDQLSLIIEKAYKKFEAEEILPIRKVQYDLNEVSIVELFHGPTKSFKDYALVVVGQLMNYFLQKRQTHTTVLVGTSGDTGSAAIQAVRGLENADIIVLYPKGQVTQVQELQMLTVLDSNVHVFQVEGTSDDLDVPINQCLPDSRLTSINSINWARITVQISHFVYVYLRNSENEAPVNIIIPSGGGGNLIAGVYANRMGFPINLYVANNENESLHNAISNGKIELSRKVIQTPANAMDIQYPYNLERLLWVNSCTPIEVKKFMTEEGIHEISMEVLTCIRQSVKGSLSVTNDQIFETMRTVWDSSEVLICPHTATAFYYWKRKLQGLEGKSFIIATASPEKFMESTKIAGINPPAHIANGLLEKLMKLLKIIPKVMKKGDNWYEILRVEISKIQLQKDNNKA